MKILAFDFSAPQRRVAALAADAEGRVLATSEDIDSSPGRASRPLSMVDRVLQQTKIARAQIDCLVVGLGPGSYTGIRAAIALAQGWQLAQKVRLLGVSSAQAIAIAAHAEGGKGPYGVVIDAQRGEYYLAVWGAVADARPSQLRELSPLRLVNRAAVEQCANEGVTLVGPEVTQWFPAGQLVQPSALTLARIAMERRNLTADDVLEPIYLRETNFVKAPPARELTVKLE